MMHHPVEHHTIPNHPTQRSGNRMGMQHMGPPPQRSQTMLIQSAVAIPPSAMKILLFVTVFLLVASTRTDSLTIKELKSMFGKKSCIEGVLVTMTQGPALIPTASMPHQPQPKPILGQQIYQFDAVPTEDQQQNVPENTGANPSIPIISLANIKEKTPMCLINELARYNKIQHQYRLTGEQGPAHKKLFTVTLKLDNEEYEAEGASIKKAQHSAAALALQQTELKHPPPKSNKNGRVNSSGTVTPTVELNALAMKRGERTVYILENGNPAHPPSFIAQTPTFYPRHNIYGPGQPRYNYNPRRNGTGRAYLPSFETRYNYGPYARYHHPPGEPFSIRLRVGEREYPGVGYTVQAARHDAASKALEDIKHKEMDENQQCAAENVYQHNEICNDLNSDLKSPISLVHELALKRNLPVTFEVLSEKGPPHMKVFITRCCVGDIVAEGEGNGKKISKKRAAEKMLEALSTLEPFTNLNTTTTMKRKRVGTKKKQRNLIKVNSDRNSDYTEEINPISRLIQIQQANKEKEPVYTVVEERGASRRREFVIEASVNGHISSGVGPNKKVAKRNAAESLLILLGNGNTTPATQSVPKPAIKVEKDSDVVEKPRKVTFMEEKQEIPAVASGVGGSGGRQLVPGLLLVNDQSGVFQQNKAKITDSEAASVTEIKKRHANIQVPGKVSQGTQSVGSKEQLLYLAQLLGVQVQFSDFPKANHEMYLTLVSVSTNPPQFCHGEGPTTEDSHEKAAKEALNVLSELGLDNVSSNTKESGADIESVTKPQVNSKSGIIQNGVQS